jgi:hypothetical protein
MERPPARTLTDDERLAFLAAEAVRYAAYIRRLRDEAREYPELMVTYGFAAETHPPTVGLLAHLHDEVRQESARAIRDENAARAMGKVLETTYE